MDSSDATAGAEPPAAFLLHDKHHVHKDFADLFGSKLRIAKLPHVADAFLDKLILEKTSISLSGAKCACGRPAFLLPRCLRCAKDAYEPQFVCPEAVPEDPSAALATVHYAPSVAFLDRDSLSLLQEVACEHDWSMEGDIACMKVVVPQDGTVVDLPVARSKAYAMYFWVAYRLRPEPHWQYGVLKYCHQWTHELHRDLPPELRDFTAVLALA